MRKKLLLIIIVAVLAVSIPVTIVLLHQGQQPSNGGNGGTSDVPSDNPNNNPTLTVMSMTEGNIFVKKAGTSSWIAAQVGISLVAGDTVKSGNSSSAKITFFDGSTIELEADTELEVVSLAISTTGSTTISLKQSIGTTISRVTKLVDSASSYEVETPACVAAVRGSEMIVNVIADGTSWVTNVRGDIWVTTNGVELQIPPGRKCIVRPGQYAELVPTERGGGGGGSGGSSPNPDIEITKMADRTQAHEGDTIVYTYTVTNPGDVPLSSVSVTDNTIGVVPYQSGDTDDDGRLDTDETWIFTAAHNVTGDDDSPLANTAAAAGTYAGFGTIVDWDTVSVDILRPAIALDKIASPTLVHDDDTVTYTYTVTNAGNTPLSGISVTDDEINDITYQGGDTNEDEILDLDDIWVFTATYITNAEDASPLVNAATASGTDALEWTVESEEATASVNILRPAIALDKTANPTEAHEGDTISYTYTVTNDGNAPLSDISVSDNMIEVVAYQSGDANKDGILDLDETWVFTAAYTVTAEDNSPLVNTATASGSDALGQTVNAQASTSVTIIADIPAYGIRIELTWNTDNTDLDAHLIRPSGRYGDETNDCHWLNENPDWGLPGVAVDDPSLNGDFQYGYGPEIITLEQPCEQGIYQYKVNYQTDHGQGSSLATVKVWINDDMVWVDSKEMSNEEIWDCCSIYWPSGEVTPAEE
jgi:uncharacterized repeat protein (TIGR01451 family)